MEKEKRGKREKKFKKDSKVIEREKKSGREMAILVLAPAADVRGDFLYEPVRFSPGGHHYCFKHGFRFPFAFFLVNFFLLYFLVILSALYNECCRDNNGVEL